MIREFTKTRLQATKMLKCQRLILSVLWALIGKHSHFSRYRLQTTKYKHILIYWISYTIILTSKHTSKPSLFLLTGTFCTGTEYKVWKPGPESANLLGLRWLSLSLSDRRLFRSDKVIWMAQNNIVIHYSKYALSCSYI